MISSIPRKPYRINALRRARARDPDTKNQWVTVPDRHARRDGMDDVTDDVKALGRDGDTIPAARYSASRRDRRV